MKSHDKNWLKLMIACLFILPLISSCTAESGKETVKESAKETVRETVKETGDANKFEVATSIATLEFDTSNAPDLKQWTKEKFAPAIKEWVVKLTDIMASDGWTPPEKIYFQFVNVKLRDADHAPAWAVPSESQVSLRVDWFRENLDGEALGSTIHELTHVMQNYWTNGANENNCPEWASEGYADYIRWVLYEPESKGCDFVLRDPDGYHYNDSYRVSAHFFGFVESRFPGTMKKFNAALRDHSFDNGKFWKDATGKTVEELEADWRAANKKAAAEKKGKTE